MYKISHTLYEDKFYTNATLHHCTTYYVNAVKKNTSSKNMYEKVSMRACKHFILWCIFSKTLNFRGNYTDQSFVIWHILNRLLTYFSDLINLVSVLRPTVLCFLSACVWNTDEHVQCESKKSPLRGPDIFHFFFTNGWEFLIDFYTPIIRSYPR